MTDERTYLVRRSNSSEREYRLYELTWLWRTAQLPHDATFRDEDGAWKPVSQLVEPFLQSTGQASGAAPTTQIPRRTVLRKWLVIGSVCGLAALVIAAVLTGQLESWTLQKTSGRPDSQPKSQKGRDDFIESSAVLPGMTHDQVRRTIGPPRAIKATGDASLERWLYRRQTVVFEDGKVVGVEAAP